MFDTPLPPNPPMWKCTDEKAERMNLLAKTVAVLKEKKGGINTHDLLHFVERIISTESVKQINADLSKF